MRSSLIQQIVVIGQDQRRLGAIVVPNKDEVLQSAKNSSIVDPDAVDIGRDKMTSLLYEELSKWTSECTFQVGPILVVDEPFTIDSGLMTPTMKIRRDRVVLQYEEEIANLFK
ncbi:probable acyl-activating enzyme 16, chloroplastic [Hibiscus syriacus]|uniref:probable acyl-activating enzyme 16, chloroplastic n=1 Tax=Hibiscus syriacus TaxID=106335 RepID=UPI001922AC7A|nr:probable acyl-activating enzyme 16, chloroplastic [Hibiscus syriacus]